MRFSDLKKLKEELPRRRPAPAAPAPQVEAPAPRPPSPPVSAPEPAAPAAPAAPEKAEGRKRAPGPRLMNSQEPAGPRPPQAASFEEQSARAREVYARLLAQAGAFLKSVDEPYTEKYESLAASCALAAETLKVNSALLYFTSYSTADDYLRAHTANTTLLALAMGLEAGLDPAELRLLGFCAMAHDIGMTEYSSLYNREDRLDEEDLSEMTLHAEAGAAKLDRIVDLDYKVKERARRIVLQTHERADGSGYPDHASDEELDPLAQLISIADAYEAMTHPRAWRGPLAPPDAIKELIAREGRGFNAGAVKLLISVVSLFPPGSMVELSTGEIARVLRVNRGSLTRPLVQIELDPDFNAAPPRQLDLVNHQLTAIERSVAAAELEERNPKYAARLDLARWWVDWQ